MTPFNKEAVRAAIHHHAFALAQHYANGAHVIQHRHEVRIGTKGARVFDTQKGLYHDFEAGTGGDAFSFVQALTGCNFEEVPQIVAQFAGGGQLIAAPLPRPHHHEDEAQRASKQKYALALWNDAHPLGGCHAR
ncbi:MAG: hypothetical protein EAZ52_05320 [Alphaproteobacteria bacterium]|nr:MAG: hypothetical protein EAZ52_05320 [Alphaproteobacteria bacterium]